MAGEPSHPPVGVQRFVANPVGVEMVEAIPTPHHFPLTCEFDDRVPHDHLGLAGRIGIPFAGIKIGHLLSIRRKGHEVSVGELVNAMVQRLSFDGNGCVIGALRTMPGVPSLALIAEGIDFGEAKVRGEIEKIAVVQSNGIGHASLSL